MRLLQGDCLEQMRTLETNSIDLVLTDPPYGTTAAKWDLIIPIEEMWRELYRVIKPGAPILLFASQPFTSLLITSNLSKYRYCWHWRKTQHSNPFLASYQPLRVLEDITVFCSAPPPYHIETQATCVQHPAKRSEIFNGAPRPHTQTRTGYPKNVLDYQRDKGFHPTQKPVALLQYLIGVYTVEGQTVLDFTMGSGSTGVAAKKSSRRFVGIERDSTYFNTATERIATA